MTVNVNHLVLLENSNIVKQAIALIDGLEVTPGTFCSKNSLFFC